MEKLIKLLSLLESKDWDYKITNGKFHMVLGNAERQFKINDEQELQDLIDDIEMW